MCDFSKNWKFNDDKADLLEVRVGILDINNESIAQIYDITKPDHWFNVNCTNDNYESVGCTSTNSTFNNNILTKNSIFKIPTIKPVPTPPNKMLYSCDFTKGTCYSTTDGWGTEKQCNQLCSKGLSSTENDTFQCRTYNGKHALYIGSCNPCVQPNTIYSTTQTICQNPYNNVCYDKSTLPNNECIPDTVECNQERLFAIESDD